MSKQFLTTHAVDESHPSDIFSLAVTLNSIVSASGSSKLKIHSTSSSDFPETQVLEGAHKLGCHHVSVSANGTRAASAGFGGEVKIWSIQATDAGHEKWIEEGKIIDGNKAGELWAIALSADGQYMASSTYDGRINVWDLNADRAKIQEYETKGSFGMCIDLSSDGLYTASGHASGAVFVFDNTTGRLKHSLPGLIKPLRCVKFSPLSRLLAAAGDARIIALYDPRTGEQITMLSGHASWIFSIDWNSSGEYLLSAGWDGKVKVWDVEERQCVSTISESDKTIWSCVWLKRPGKGASFAAAGAGRTISFYREAAGG